MIEHILSGDIFFAYITIRSALLIHARCHDGNKERIKWAFFNLFGPCCMSVKKTKQNGRHVKKFTS